MTTSTKHYSTLELSIAALYPLSVIVKAVCALIVAIHFGR